MPITKEVHQAINQFQDLIWNNQELKWFLWDKDNLINLALIFIPEVSCIKKLNKNQNQELNWQERLKLGIQPMNLKRWSNLITWIIKENNSQRKGK